ncbi:MAG: DUF262 domain-containing HNH endonuclease family protein [Alphaproteobacteria bacterium]|jgi:uncharacterized protein with ParB-like and HNH nuclease domain|nr:DUF262 domain-containing HNH endonuclease family protein [Alphaproteobacteria bacterium]
MSKEIKTSKETVGYVFNQMEFIIPSYQRPYVWSKDNVNQLLDDTFSAMQEKPENEYFLGSCVSINKENSRQHHLLDGQQRITTLFLIFVVLRDIATDDKLRNKVSGIVFQPEDTFEEGKSSISRISYETKENIKDLINKLAKIQNYSSLESLKKYESENDTSIKNILEAINTIRDFFDGKDLESYLKFLLNKVCLICVSTEELDDAFRLFTVLNSRGIPLTPSDLLKAENLREIPSKEQLSFARKWEDMEKDLPFVDLLNYLRTILIKDKAKESLFNEFQKIIYTEKKILKRGEETFEFIKNYADIYEKLFIEKTKNYEIDNLIQLMSLGLSHNEWIPSVLYYYERFQNNSFLEFLTYLDNKLSSMWICGVTPSKRLTATYKILDSIEKADSFESVIDDKGVFKIDIETTINRLNENYVYYTPYSKYTLLKLDYLHSENTQEISYPKIISMEHILPKTPNENSQWYKDFSPEQMESLTHKLGNLILLSGRKNSKLGNKDYQDKKDNYFNKKIEVYHNSTRVMQNNQWTPVEIEKNQEHCINLLKKHYNKNN